MSSGAHDAVVIGAGHNGLTCACYLARAGLRVLTDLGRDPGRHGGTSDPARRESAG